VVQAVALQVKVVPREQRPGQRAEEQAHGHADGESAQVDERAAKVPAKTPVRDDEVVGKHENRGIKR